MAEVKGKGRAAAAVLVALIAVLGLPAQAALAQGPGNTIDATPEPITVNVGGNADIVATKTNGPATVSTTVSFELVGLGSDDTPDTADGACVIPVNGTTCFVTLAALGGSTASPGTGEMFVWFDNAATADCDAQHPSCLGAPAREPAQPDDADNTDVVAVTVVANQGFSIDCAPDTQNLTTGVAAQDITCTVKDSSGAVTTAIEVDLENLGPSFDADAGQFSPVDADAVGTGTFTFNPNPTAGGTVPPGGSLTGPSTPGTVNLCFFLDTNSALDDTGATGPDAGDGGDCAAERANPAIDDSDGTDVVCISWGQGACATGIVPPPGTNSNPVITGAGCANGIGAVTFRPILGAELAGLLPAPFNAAVLDVLLTLQPPDVFPVSADDPDGGATTLTLSGGPSWLSLQPTNPVSGDPAAGGLRGIPSAADILLNPTGSATLTAVDNEGASTTCVVAVSVGLGLGGIPIPGLGQ